LHNKKRKDGHAVYEKLKELRVREMGSFSRIVQSWGVVWRRRRHEVWQAVPRPGRSASRHRWSHV